MIHRPACLLRAVSSQTVIATSGGRSVVALRRQLFGIAGTCTQHIRALHERSPKDTNKQKEINDPFSSSSLSAFEDDFQDGDQTESQQLASQAGEQDEVLDLNRYSEVENVRALDSHELRVQRPMFFQPGRLFMTHLPNLSSERRRLTSTDQSRFIMGLNNTVILQKPRIFVVVSNRQNFALALGVFTYGHLGTAAHYVDPAYHGIIHSRRIGPVLSPEEQQAPPGCTPVRAIINPKLGQMDTNARINYGAYDAIDMAVPVLPVGFIDPHDLHDFRVNVRKTLDLILQPADGPDQQVRSAITSLRPWTGSSPTRGQYERQKDSLIRDLADHVEYVHPHMSKEDCLRRAQETYSLGMSDDIDRTVNAILHYDEEVKSFQEKYELSQRHSQELISRHEKQRREEKLAEEKAQQRLRELQKTAEELNEQRARQAQDAGVEKAYEERIQEARQEQAAMLQRERTRQRSERLRQQEEEQGRKQMQADMEQLAAAQQRADDERKSIQAQADEAQAQQNSDYERRSTRKTDKEDGDMVSRTNIRKARKPASFWQKTYVGFRGWLKRELLRER